MASSVNRKKIFQHSLIYMNQKEKKIFLNCDRCKENYSYVSVQGYKLIGIYILWMKIRKEKYIKKIKNISQWKAPWIISWVFSHIKLYFPCIASYANCKISFLKIMVERAKRLSLSSKNYSCFIYLQWR